MQLWWSLILIMLQAEGFYFRNNLTLSWWRPLSYRNQSIDLQSKSVDWFLYDNGLRHERLKMARKKLKDKRVGSRVLNGIECKKRERETESWGELGRGRVVMNDLRRLRENKRDNIRCKDAYWRNNIRILTKYRRVTLFFSTNYSKRWDW